MDATIPGGVYLCQVGPTVSCGACCGLYNVSAVGRDEIHGMLTRRTTLFADVARKPAAIDAYGREIVSLEGREHPFSDFHHCPFLGLVGRAGLRVGCLLHPLAEGNRGIDWRGLSYYGGMACRVYFCPSCRELAPRYKLLLRSVIDDWYLFGLMVTEHRLVNTLLGFVETRLGRHLAPDSDAFPSVSGRRALQRLLSIKIDWNRRHAGSCHPCHYMFEDGKYPRPVVVYPLGCQPSPYDILFQDLGVCFADTQSLRLAETWIDQRLAQAAEALGRKP